MAAGPSVSCRAAGMLGPAVAIGVCAGWAAGGCVVDVSEGGGVRGLTSPEARSKAASPYALPTSIVLICGLMYPMVSAMAKASVSKPTGRPSSRVVPGELMYMVMGCSVESYCKKRS